MINTERNRALLTDLFAALGREGWAEVFLAALRDDVVFNAMGRSPIAGHYEGKRVYSEEVLEKLHDRLLVRPTLVVDKIIVDGDMASVRFHSTGGKGKNGADFSMDYRWVFRLIDGAIAEIWGYYDTGKMIDLFGERPLSVGTAEGDAAPHPSGRHPATDRGAAIARRGDRTRLQACRGRLMRIISVQRSARLTDYDAKRATRST
jgi:uncharacterized protein